MSREDKPLVRLHRHVPLVTVVVTQPLASPGRFAVAGIAHCNLALAAGVFIVPGMRDPQAVGIASVMARMVPPDAQK